MLLSSFDDYMFYWSIAHLFHTSLVTAYWATNMVTGLLLVGGYSGADIQTVAIKKARRLYHQQRVQFTLNSLSITKKALILERPLRYL